MNLMKPNRLHILCLTWLASLWISVQAQIPGMKAYSQLDGYPGTVGYVVQQDERGFIWIGTDNGAVLFDGKRFKVIDERMNLVDKEILVAAPVKGGRVVLVPLLNNLSYYENGKVITAWEDQKLKLLNGKTLNHVFRDRVTGEVWVADDRITEGLLHFYGDSIVAEQISFSRPSYVHGVMNNRIYLQSDEEKVTVFGTYDLRSKKFDTLFTESGIFPLGYLSEDAGHMVVYLPSDNRIIAFEIKEGKKAVKLWEQKLSSEIKHVVIDRNHDLWLTYQRGGVEYRGNINSAEKNEPLLFLEDVIINYVFTDRDNNKWFTTKDKGLLFISEKHWENVLLVKRRQLPSNMPLGICGDSSGRVYIGYHKPFLSVMDGGKTHTLPLSPVDYGLGVRIVKSVDRHICVGGNSILNFMKMGEKGLSLDYRYFVAGYSIKDFARVEDNRWMLATHSGVFIVDPRQDSMDPFLPPLFPGRATAICPLDDQRALIGTPNGLFLQKSHRTPARKIRDSLLSQAHITSFAQAQNDYVLVGTSVKGLFRYNTATGEVRHVGRDGMPGTSYIRQIFFQNDTLCWLATDRGVFRVVFDADLQEKSVESYTFFDGLPSANTLGLFVRSDTVFVSTAAGVGVLPVRSESFPDYPRPLAWITTVRVGDSLWHFPGNLSLSHKQNDVQVSLSAIAYESLGNVKYRYKLEGLSDNWIETESPDIGFSGLLPGEYRLLVRAVNFRGVVSDTALLPIHIHPAFWQTAWFRWTMGILAAGFVFLLIFRVVVTEKNRQYRKIQQKRRLAELELEAIKAQINPHFIYNCLNSIQYFSYKKDYQPVNDYLDIFAKLIRFTMQYSQETFITLEEEKDYLLTYLKLEKLRFKEKLAYHLDIEEQIPLTTLVPSMLVQPYVENALKHGISQLDSKGEVWVKVRLMENGWLEVTVEDNGPGIRDGSVKGKSHLGMRLAGNRAKTYNQLFGLGIRVSLRANGPHGGVKVQLLIPPIRHENTRF